MRAVPICLVICALAQSFIGHAAAQQPSRGLTAEEQSMCRADAIRYCFFSIANAEALRSCLRSKKLSLSAPCQKLITSRGN
jgi:hypothetical protein